MDTIQEKENIRPELHEEKKKKKKKKRNAWEKRKEKKAREREKIKQKKEEEVEFAFVLCLPFVFRRRTVGAVLQEFTNIGLKLLDLRCVSVTRKFIDAYFENEGRFTFTDSVMGYVSDGPFLALKLEGANAVKRACELVSKKKERPLWDYWPLVYSSDTVERALDDAETWFRANSSDSLEEALKRKNVIFSLPDRGICGGLPQEELETVVNRSTIDFTLSDEIQRFVLIKPKAFEKGIMADLLSTIEKNCLYLKGLKLVKKSEVPHSVAWSDDNSSSSGETQEEEFGIALIAWLPDLVFDAEGSLIIEKHIIGDHVSSEFVYVSAGAESFLKFVKEFFKFGVVGWLDPAITDFSGGFFDTNLIGLQFEDQDDPDKD